MGRKMGLLLSGALVALLVGCGSATNKATGARAGRPVVLTLANPNAGDADVGDWMRAVERLSHGTVRIELRAGWRADEVQAERGTLEDVRAGKVDIAKIPARAWDRLGVRSFQALQAPLLVDSLELERRVVSGAVGADMLAGVRRAGVEPVGVLPGPLRLSLGVSRDLVDAAGYRGAWIGSRPSAVAAATARALGGRYVDVAAGADVGGVDAFDASLADISSFGYDREARSVTADVVWWPRAVTFVINRAAWGRLSSVQRAALSNAAHEAVPSVMRELRSFDRSGTRVLCDHHFPLVRAGAARIDQLRRAVRPVYRQLELNAGTRRMLDRIRALKKKVPTAPVVGCRSQAEPGGPAAGPLVGTWHTHATRELLAAAHREIGESVEDSWGDVTLVLGSDARFRILNSRFPGQEVGLGTWRTRGDVLSMRAEGTVEQGAGDTWRYRWTLFRDALMLRKLSVAPTALVVAPLRH
jgi:TRAP-type C4-dicarboxylate transport system substrate-binding protein